MTGRNPDLYCSNPPRQWSSNSTSAITPSPRRLRHRNRANQHSPDPQFGSITNLALLVSSSFNKRTAPHRSLASQSSSHPTPPFSANLSTPVSEPYLGARRRRRSVLDPGSQTHPTSRKRDDVASPSWMGVWPPLAMVGTPFPSSLFSQTLANMGRRYSSSLLCCNDVVNVEAVVISHEQLVGAWAFCRTPLPSRRSYA